MITDVVSLVLEKGKALTVCRNGRKHVTLVLLSTPLPSMLYGTYSGKLWCVQLVTDTEFVWASLSDSLLPF